MATDLQWLQFLVQFEVINPNFPDAPKDELSLTKSELFDFIMENDIVK